jgi:SAM-dependent methyltransferase
MKNPLRRAIPANDTVYEAFAYAYDKALGSRFFAAASRLLDELLPQYVIEAQTHLDVACGTALAMTYFENRGFRSTGVDLSLSMLQLARRRSSRLVAGDFRALPFRTAFGCITCLYDSFNHLLEPKDLVAAFRAVRAVMDDGSLFLFDMNHPDVYPEVWGLAEPFVSTGVDYRLDMATSYRKRERIGTAVVRGWAIVPAGLRVEIDETHVQRAYSEREIRDCLREAGLRAVQVVDFDPYEELGTMEADGVKLFFVCMRT